MDKETKEVRLLFLYLKVTNDNKTFQLLQGFKAAMIEGNMTTPQAELSAEVLRFLEQQQMAGTGTESKTAPSTATAGVSSTTGALGEKEQRSN